MILLRLVQTFCSTFILICRPKDASHTVRLQAPARRVEQNPASAWPLQSLQWSAVDAAPGIVASNPTLDYLCLARENGEDEGDRHEGWSLSSPISAA